MFILQLSLSNHQRDFFSNFKRNDKKKAPHKKRAFVKIYKFYEEK